MKGGPIPGGGEGENKGMDTLYLPIAPLWLKNLLQAVD